MNARDAHSSAQPKRLSIVELNRLRRGLLVVARGDHPWVRAIEHGHASAEETHTPYWSWLWLHRLATQIEKGKTLDSVTFPGAPTDAATHLLEWIRAFGLLEQRATAYGVPPANIVASIAAVTPRALDVPPDLRSFFTSPDKSERAWVYRIKNYFERLPPSDGG